MSKNPKDYEFPDGCSDPPLQPNTIGPVCNCPYLLGETCSYPCAPGYHVISDEDITRTCLSSGQWTETDLVCQDVNEEVEEVDECLENPTICGSNAICVNGPGYFDCVCVAGFVMASGGCQDIDECSSGEATCDVNAFCVNTAGTYHCVCLEGFTGDGNNCQQLTTTTSTTTMQTTEKTTSSTTASTTPPVLTTSWYPPTDAPTSTLVSTTSTKTMKTTTYENEVWGELDTTEEVSTVRVSTMTTIPLLTPSTAEPTLPPRVFTTTQESSTQTSFLKEEEIPNLISTLGDKVTNFRGSLDDYKELLEEVTDGTSSALRAQSSSRESVAMETTFDLSFGVTDEVKDLIDVDSPDMSPVEQLEKKKRERELLKSRVKDETMGLLDLLDAAADKLLQEAPPEGGSTRVRSDGVLTAVMKTIPEVGIIPIDQDVGSIVLTQDDSLPRNSSIKVVAFKKDPFVWNEEETEVSSSVVMVTVTKGSEEDGGQTRNTAAPNITVDLRSDVMFDTTKEHEQDTLSNTNSEEVDDARSSFPLSKVPRHGTNMTYHAMYITSEGQAPLLRFSVDDVDTELQVYARFHDFPTEEEYDYTTTVKPPEMTDYEGFEMPYGLVYSNFNVSFAPEVGKQQGWVIVGVKTKAYDVPESGFRRLLTSSSQATPPLGRHGNRTGFSLETAAVSCLMWGMDNQTWSNQRCKVGTQTDETTTRCTCGMALNNDGSSSRAILGSSFLPVPNFVDFSNLGSNFNKLSSNSTVFGTVVAMWMMFIVAQLLILRSNIKVC
ncbi:uncharacterized protein LOC144909158 [Branchiostoma floridae x Branchiostoma belcheri]